MGGQACVLYGAAQFSRDVDLAVLVDDENLARLREGLAGLDAEAIAVPEFRREFLEQGLAIHFRCRGGESDGIRIDVMSNMRGVAPFNELWERRVMKEWDGVAVAVMGIEDLVQAKKTQQDKDWPMIRQLMERAYYEEEQGREEFLLRELRTAELLVELARKKPELARQLMVVRALLDAAIEGDVAAVRRRLREEEDAEREADRNYWQPLKAELERLRREKRG